MHMPLEDMVAVLVKMGILQELRKVKPACSHCLSFTLLAISLYHHRRSVGFALFSPEPT